MNCIVCGKKLRKHNTIGTCREHRGLSSVRRAYEYKWKANNANQYSEVVKQWKEENRESLNIWYKKYHENPEKKIAHNLRVRIRRAIKRGSHIKNLGCTLSELKLHLENKFDANMTWENYGNYWHIDHIKPLSKFNLLNEEELKQACHYTNLQPLECIENIKKGNRLDYVPTSVGLSNER